MLVAAPVLQDYDSYLTGLYEYDVITYVTYPMISPATSPNAIHENISMNECMLVLPSLRTNWKESMHAQQTKNSPGISSTVDIINWNFRPECTFYVESTYCPYVIMALVTRLTHIPIPGIHNTNIIELKLYTPYKLDIELQAITNAAHVDSANEPNKSAPMPATSPTLSPTLSAIVAGFLGLSYGKFCYTFPTKSEPKSAALVNMPPPTLANMAMVDPPSPYPATA